MRSRLTANDFASPQYIGQLPKPTIDTACVQETKRPMKMPSVKFLFFLVTISVFFFSQPAAANTKKILIAHRGASAYAPEHTIAAYSLAIQQGADYVEQDLAIAQAGVLICLHDMTLERTTNIAEVFPNRFLEEEKDGKKIKVWYAVDFTLEEIKKLDAGSWFGENFKGERIPTFAEAIQESKNKAGRYPELKDPEFYRAKGFDMEKLFLNELRKFKLDKNQNKKTPVIVQSFSEMSLKRLTFEFRTKLPLVLLIDSKKPNRLTEESLKETKKFASGVGPSKLLVTKEIVERVHKLGLTITPYTFRSSNTGVFKNVSEEMSHYLYKLGVDAVFTDNPDKFPREQ